MLLSEAINFRINELLKERGLSAYKLSYMAGISNSIISDMRRGKVKKNFLLVLLFTFVKALILN